MQKATRNKLSQTLKVKSGYLGKLVYRIRKISDTAYIRVHRLHPATEGRRRSGPPRVYYELIGEDFVTFPETAVLLLELLVYPKSLPRRVNCSDFVKEMSTKFRLTESNVLGRIQWAMRHDYVISDDECANIAPLERCAHEKPYLELLASHFSGRVSSVSAT